METARVIVLACLALTSCSSSKGTVNGHNPESGHKPGEASGLDAPATRLIWGPNKKWRYELSVGPLAPAPQSIRITRQATAGVSVTVPGVAIDVWGAIDLRGGEATLVVSQRPRETKTQLAWLNSPGDKPQLALLLTTRHEQGDITDTRLHLLDGASLTVLWQENIERAGPAGAFASLELRIVPGDSDMPVLELLQHALPATGEVQMPGPPVRLRFEADESGRYQIVGT